jgi:lipid-binding SYLF domain-containing protein
MGASGGTPLLGWGQSTVVLVLLSDRALKSAVDDELSFNVGHPEANGKDICQFADAGALYGGGSLGGTAPRSRDALDMDYYGVGATAPTILFERRFDHPGAIALQESLGEMGRVSDSAPPCGEASKLAFGDVRGTVW